MNCRTRAGAGAAVDERRKELKDLMAQKQELDATYTPDYPDVVAINRKIADLQAEIAHAPTEPAPGGSGHSGRPTPAD